MPNHEPSTSAAGVPQGDDIPQEDHVTVRYGRCGKLEEIPILCLELSWQKKATLSSPTSQATPNS